MHIPSVISPDPAHVMPVAEPPLVSAALPSAVPSDLLRPVETGEVDAAISVIRSRFGISRDQAFAALNASVDRTGRSLPELAIAVVDTARRQAAAGTHHPSGRRATLLRPVRIASTPPSGYVSIFSKSGLNGERWRRGR